MKRFITGYAAGLATGLLWGASFALRVLMDDR